MDEFAKATDMAAEEAAAVKAARYLPTDGSLIDYGPSSCNLAGVEGVAETYYISTAIAYTNGYPHMGHAYESLTTDVAARYHRILGYDTLFCTGSDEHGQKVAASAVKAGRTPLQHCNIYVNAFQALNQRLRVKNDIYVRTTDPYHEETAKRMWKMCSDKGDIYLDAYEGWYNEREEMFVTDKDAEAAGFKDPGSGLDLKKVKEESYFFRMGNYCERLLAHIEANPDCIQPEEFKNSILARLRKDGLRDLSISRTSFSWGIAMPEGFDQKHVMYVWFDALSNYMTGVHGLDTEHPLARYWPAQRHVIGKDIIWFHCVIWPCMLMSANLPLPLSVYSHGFVNADDGRKMSKSYNNVIDPHDVLDKFEVDTVRYYMCSATPYGSDLNFSDGAMILSHNAELADTLGNLLHRALNLNDKYSDGCVPDTTHDAVYGVPFDAAALIEGVINDMKTLSISSAIFKTMDAVRATNRFLTEAEPWKMKGDDMARRSAIVRTTLEACYIFAHFLAPVIPVAAGKIFERLGAGPVAAGGLRADFYNLPPGTQTKMGDVLFKKIEMGEETDALKSGGAGKKEKSGTKGGGKGKAKGADEVVLDPAQPDFSKIELKVGRIVKVWNHEAADKLYCEEIDCGEDTPRQVASGLRAHYSLEDMTDRLVVVVTNLKDSKLVGFVSQGMVLCAKGDDGKVQLLDPPAGAEVGERLLVVGTEGPAWPANKVKKQKIWEAMSADLKTDASGAATWKGVHISVPSAPGGLFTVPACVDSPIA